MEGRLAPAPSCGTCSSRSHVGARGARPRAAPYRRRRLPPPLTPSVVRAAHPHRGHSQDDAWLPSELSGQCQCYGGCIWLPQQWRMGRWAVASLPSAAAQQCPARAPACSHSFSCCLFHQPCADSPTCSVDIVSGISPSRPGCQHDANTRCSLCDLTVKAPVRRCWGAILLSAPALLRNMFCSTGLHQMPCAVLSIMTCTAAAAHRMLWLAVLRPNPQVRDADWTALIGALFRSSPHDSAIFALALPAVLALAADPLLSMVDTIFVGQVRAAVLLTSWLLCCPSCACQLLRDMPLLPRLCCMASSLVHPVHAASRFTTGAAAAACAGGHRRAGGAGRQLRAVHPGFCGVQLFGNRHHTHGGGLAGHGGQGAGGQGHAAGK